MMAALVVMELVWAGGLFGLGVLSLVVGRATHAAIGGPVGWTLAAAAAVLAWVLAAALFAGLVPRLRPGRHAVLSPAGVAFALGLVARRWLAFPLVDFAWRQSTFLRWAVLSLQGARLALDSQMSSDADIFDPALYHAGPRSMLGSKATVAGHLFVGETLVLAPVRIGAGALIGFGARIGPGATIGAGAQINPGASIGVDAEVGAGATIELGASVGTGARIGAGARVHSLVAVPAKTVVPDGAHFGGPGERASGAMDESGDVV